MKTYCRLIFFCIVFGLKILCVDEFPGFTLDDYEDLELILALIQMIGMYIKT